MSSAFSLSDELRFQRSLWRALDLRARNPRTDPRTATEAELERDAIARRIADLEEKIQSATRLAKPICQHNHPTDLCGVCNPVDNAEPIHGEKDA